MSRSAQWLFVYAQSVVEVGFGVHDPEKGEHKPLLGDKKETPPGSARKSGASGHWAKVRRAGAALRSQARSQGGEGLLTKVENGRDPSCLANGSLISAIVVSHSR